MGLLITVSGPANNDTTPIDWCAILCPSNDPDWCADCTPPPPPPPPPPLPTHSKISVPLKISLVILVVTFSLFLLYTLFKFYSVWRRTSRRRSPASDPDPENPRTDHAFLDQDLGPVIDHPIWYIRTVGLQPSVINSITVIKFNKGERVVDGTDCSVCLSEFEDGDTLRLLPACNHAFHLPCIDTWLSSHTNCPLCRAGIEQVVLDASSSSAGSSGGETLEGSSGESGGSELRIRVDEEIDDVFPKSGVSGVELAVVRRSVSLDSSVASRISFAVNAAMAKNSDQSYGARMVGTEETDSGVVQRSVDVDQQNLVGLAGSSRTFQRGPNFIRRSFSCSGKVLPSRHSGGEDSVPPS